MTKRLVRVSLIATSTLIAGALAAPTFGQSYGAMPRGYCAKSTRVSYAPPVRVHPQPVYDAGYSAPVREAQRRRARGFGSPF
jgi:hypothetical protein